MTNNEGHTLIAILVIVSSVVGLGLMLWFDRRRDKEVSEREAPVRYPSGDRFSELMWKTAKHKAEQEAKATADRERNQREPSRHGKNLLPFAMRNQDGPLPDAWDGDRDDF
jgi:hypothetical protein